MSYIPVKEIISMNILTRDGKNIGNHATKLVNIKTNDSYFFKSILGPIGSELDPKYQIMADDDNLYVDNNFVYYDVYRISPNSITCIVKDQFIIFSKYETKLVNIQTNESFFFKSIRGEPGETLDPKYYEMVRLQHLCVEATPPIPIPEKKIFGLFGGKKYRSARRSKNLKSKSKKIKYLGML